MVLTVGRVTLCKGGDTGGESAAPDGDEDDVNQRELFIDLHGDGSLAGCDSRIIKGMDKGIAVLFCKLERVPAGLVVHVAVQDDLGTQGLGAVHLDERRRGRHDDHGLAAVAFRCVGDTLGVVSGRGGDQALCPCLVRKRAYFVIGAADLVGTGALHILRLEIYLRTGQITVIVGLDEIRGAGNPFHNLTGPFKGFNR